MYDRFRGILIHVFWYRISFLIIFFVIGTILNISYLFQIKADFKSRRAGRKYQRIRDYEIAKKNIVEKAIVGLIGIICSFLFWALPPYMDALNEDYVTIEAIYARENKDMRSGIPNIGGNIHLIVGEDSISVELFPGFSEAEFPEGEYQAIVCYGAKSRILLSVELLSDSVP